MFASDRDLLVLEPNLFRDVGWVGQRLVKGFGDVSGTSLTLTSQDVTFEAAGVDAGHVVLVESTPYEVIERLNATTVTVSRVREEEGGAVIPPTPGTARPVSVVTFRPQMAIVHGQILRLLGLEAGAGRAGSPGEEAILNREGLRLLEALGTLHLIYAAAAGPGTGRVEQSAEWARARAYQARFAAERQRAVALLDLDGDGRPDATRRLNAIQFMRM